MLILPTHKFVLVVLFWFGVFVFIFCFVKWVNYLIQSYKKPRRGRPLGSKNKITTIRRDFKGGDN